MYARERDDPETIHIDPCLLIDNDYPAYLTPEETKDRLPVSECESSIDTPHALHVEAVEEWRNAVRSHVVSEITIEASEGPHTVEVKPLG